MQKKLKYLSDEELYQLLANDKQLSKHAFDEIYSRYSSKVYTYCKKVFPNDAVAEDIFQETFIKFYETSNRNIEMTNVIGYLITICRNLCLNEKSKKNSQNVSLDNIEVVHYDEDNVDKKQIKEILDKAIQALPQNYREVLIMQDTFEMSYQEIADVLNESLSSVRIKIFRAKSKLKEILSPYIKELKDFHDF